MFFPFSQQFTYASADPAVIWEVETALAAVLKESIESSVPLELKEVCRDAKRLLQVGFFLNSRTVLIELKNAIETNKKLLCSLLEKLKDEDFRRKQGFLFEPSKESIFKMSTAHPSFAEYLHRAKKGIRL